MTSLKTTPLITSPRCLKPRILSQRFCVKGALASDGPTNDSWRVDETYVKAKGLWQYLYRAVDSKGNTLNFMLNARRDVRIQV